MDKILDKNNIDIVLYHKDSTYGFGVAFCSYLYDKNDKEYIGCSYNDDINDEFFNKLTDKNILLCDFSLKIDILVKIVDRSKSILIIDRHKTTADNLASIPDNLKMFDISRSGASITWEYFFPDKPLPKLIALIHDRDLWNYKLEDSDAFRAYLFDKKFTFELFESLLDQHKLSEAITTGKYWLEYRNILINAMVKHTHQVIQKIGDKLMIVAYVDNASLYISEVGHRVLNCFPMSDFSALSAHCRERNSTKFSLLSQYERVDVSLIAKEHGGGGCSSASSLMINGLTLSLPYKFYDDDILCIMKNAEILWMMKNAESDNYEKFTYAVLKIDVIDPVWLDDEYLTLIKRKFPDNKYIIFQLSRKNNKNTYFIISNVEMMEYKVMTTDKSLEYILSNHI